MVSRPLKKQQSTPIKIGDVVTFIYHSQRVHGIARFIGQTDFSANTLCGVALSEDVGKHNGTVKGRKYFVCPDKHGVFVPLRKVSLTPPALHDLIKKRLRSTNKEESEEKEEEEPFEEEIEEQLSDDEMRITVRSYKAPQKVSTNNKVQNNPGNASFTKNKDPPNSDRSVVSSNSSCDSGFESPTRLSAEQSKEKFSSRRTKAKTKNIVVSSFIAESPQKPVIFNSFDEDSTSSIPEQVLSSGQKVQLKKHAISNSEEELDSEVFEKEVETSLTSEHVKRLVKEEVCEERIKTNNVESSSPSLPTTDDTEDGKTKIPKRVASAAKMFENIEQKTNPPSSKVKSPTPFMQKSQNPSNIKSPSPTVGKLQSSSAIKSPTPSFLKSQNLTSLRSPTPSSSTSVKSSLTSVKPTSTSSSIRARTTQVKRTTVTANIPKLWQPTSVNKTNTSSPSSSPRKSSTEAKSHVTVKTHSKPSLVPSPRKTSAVKQDTSKKG